MNNSKKIFEILGVEPEEEFKIKVNNLSNVRDRYKFDKNLNLYGISKYTDYKWEKSPFTLQRFLIGDIEIIKLSNVSEKELAAINYAKACGCKWLAKDADGKSYAFSDKPQKNSTYWNNTAVNTIIIEMAIPLSFIHWKDKEPYYIDEENYISKTEEIK